MRFLIALMLLFSMGLVRMRASLKMLNSGETGAIAYSEIEVSDTLLTTTRPPLEQSPSSPASKNHAGL